VLEVQTLASQLIQKGCEAAEVGVGAAEGPPQSLDAQEDDVGRRRTRLEVEVLAQDVVGVLASQERVLRIEITELLSGVGNAARHRERRPEVGDSPGGEEGRLGR